MLPYVKTPTKSEDSCMYEALRIRLVSGSVVVFRAGVIPYHRYVYHLCAERVLQQRKSSEAAAALGFHRAGASEGKAACGADGRAD